MSAPSSPASDGEDGHRSKRRRTSGGEVSTVTQAPLSSKSSLPTFLLPTSASQIDDPIVSDFHNKDLIAQMNDQELLFAVHKSQLRKMIPFGWLAHGEYLIKLVCPYASFNIPSDRSGAFALDYSQYSLAPNFPSDLPPVSNELRDSYLPNSAICTALAFVIFGNSIHGRTGFRSESDMEASLSRIMKLGYFIWTTFERATILTECFRNMFGVVQDAWPLKRYKHPVRMTQEIAISKYRIPHNALINGIVRYMGFVCESATTGKTVDKKPENSFLQDVLPYYHEGFMSARSILASHDVQTVVASSVFAYGDLPSENPPFYLDNLDVDPWAYFANILKKITVLCASFRMWQTPEERARFPYVCPPLVEFRERINLERSKGVPASLDWVVTCAETLFHNMPYVATILLDEDTSVESLVSSLAHQIADLAAKHLFPRWLLNTVRTGDPITLYKVLPRKTASRAQCISGSIRLWALLVIRSFPMFGLVNSNMQTDLFSLYKHNTDSLLGLALSAIDATHITRAQALYKEFMEEITWWPPPNMCSSRLFNAVLPLSLNEMVKLLEHARSSDRAFMRTCIIRLSDKMSYTIGVCLHQDPKSLLPDCTQTVYFLFNSLPSTEQQGACFLAVTERKAFIQLLASYNGLKTCHIPRITFVNPTAHLQTAMAKLRSQFEAVSI